jgi:hypothetical protein
VSLDESVHETGARSLFSSNDRLATPGSERERTDRDEVAEGAAKEKPVKECVMIGDDENKRQRERANARDKAEPG